MTDRSVVHDSFSLERTYAATPGRVFAAWSKRDAKDRWFGEGDDFLTRTDQYTLDFRVDGSERLGGTLPDGRTFDYHAVYHDIVDDQRIIASYEVRIDGRRVSVSLMTVELAAVPEGTRLVMTEQGAFLDGLDTNDQRQDGAEDSLDKLGELLGRPD